MINKVRIIEKIGTGTGKGDSGTGGDVVAEDLQIMKDDAKSREEIGQYLKRVREEKGISLRTVAEETKIRVRYLKALEEGDYATLPGNVYARGFLRNYARFLGVELPRHQSIIPTKARGEVPEQQTVVIKPTRRPGQRSGLRVLLLLLLAGIVVIYSFSFLPHLWGPGEPEPEGMGELNGDIPGGEGDVREGGGEREPEGEPEEKEESTGTVNLVQDTDHQNTWYQKGPFCR